MNLVTKTRPSNSPLLPLIKTGNVNKKLVETNQSENILSDRGSESSDEDDDNEVASIELKDLLLDSEWNTSKWNDIRITSSIDVLLEKVDSVDFISNKKQQELCFQMYKRLLDLHQCARTYTESLVVHLSNKCFQNFVKTKKNIIKIYSNACFMAFLSEYYPEKISYENPISRAMGNLNSLYILFGTLLQNIWRYKKKKKEMDTNHSDRSNKIKIKTIFILKQSDLLSRFHQLIVKLKQIEYDDGILRHSNTSNSIPEIAILQYLKIIYNLISKKSNEFQHKNNMMKIIYSNGLIPLVDYIKTKSKLSKDLTHMSVQSQYSDISLLSKKIILKLSIYPEYIVPLLYSGVSTILLNQVVINSSNKMFSPEIVLINLEILLAIVKNMVIELSNDFIIGKILFNEDIIYSRKNITKKKLISTYFSTIKNLTNLIDFLLLNLDLINPTRNFCLDMDGFVIYSKNILNIQIYLMKILTYISFHEESNFIILNLLLSNGGRNLEKIITSCFINDEQKCKTDPLILMLQNERKIVMINILFTQLSSHKECRDSMTVLKIADIFLKLYPIHNECNINHVLLLTGIVLLSDQTNSIINGTSNDSFLENIDDNSNIYKKVLQNLYNLLEKICLEKNKVVFCDTITYLQKYGSIKLLFNLICPRIDSYDTDTFDSKQKFQLSFIIYRLTKVDKAICEMIFSNNMIEYLILTLQVHQMELESIEKSQYTKRFDQNKEMIIKAYLRSIYYISRSIINIIKAHKYMQQKNKKLTIVKIFYRFDSFRHLLSLIRPPIYTWLAGSDEYDMLVSCVEIIENIFPAEDVIGDNNESLVNEVDELSQYQVRLSNETKLTLLGLLSYYSQNYNIKIDFHFKIINSICKSINVLCLRNRTCIDIINSNLIQSISRLFTSGVTNNVSNSYMVMEDVSTKAAETQLNSTTHIQKLHPPYGVFQLLATVSKLSNGRKLVIDYHLLPRCLERLHVTELSKQIINQEWDYSKNDKKCYYGINRLIAAFINNFDYKNMMEINDMFHTFHVIEKLVNLFFNEKIERIHQTNIIVTIYSFCKDILSYVPRLLEYNDFVDKATFVLRRDYSNLFNHKNIMKKENYSDEYYSRLLIKSILGIFYQIVSYPLCKYHYHFNNKQNLMDLLRDISTNFNLENDTRKEFTTTELQTIPGIARETIYLLSCSNNHRNENVEKSYDDKKSPERKRIIITSFKSIPKLETLNNNKYFKCFEIEPLSSMKTIELLRTRPSGKSPEKKS